MDISPDQDLVTEEPIETDAPLPLADRVDDFPNMHVASFPPPHDLDLPRAETTAGLRTDWPAHHDAMLHGTQPPADVPPSSGLFTIDSAPSVNGSLSAAPLALPLPMDGQITLPDMLPPDSPSLENATPSFRCPALDPPSLDKGYLPDTPSVASPPVEASPTVADCPLPQAEDLPSTEEEHRPPDRIGKRPWSPLPSDTAADFNKRVRTFVHCFPPTKHGMTVNCVYLVNSA
jgi:hypothetical protein